VPTVYTYDARGSRVSATTGTDVTAYAYTASGALASVTTPSVSVSYTSDARDLRQSRTVGGATQQFTWSSVGALPLLLGDGEHSYIYGASSTPIAQVDATGDVEYLHADLLGTPRLVTDDAGVAVGSVSFDAFGTVAAQAGVRSAFGFTGNWSDPDTGLLYLRARDYDPATGQFLTVDPLVDQTRQPYAYTANSPASRTDPTGMDFWEDLGTNVMAFWAGGSDGVGFNIPMALDCSSYNKYKDNGFYWAGDVVGVLLAVATLTAAADLRIGPAILSRTAARTPVALTTTASQLEAKFSKHALDFGVTASRGKEGFAAFDQALKSFVQSPSTIQIEGLYRKDPYMLNYDPNSRLVVIQDMNGVFVSGWRMSQSQLQNVVEKGSLGGG
jgi:RHS repeat-associated protein